MTAKKDLFDQSRYIDLDDDDLKEQLGFLHEQAKRLSEAEKTDPEVERMKGELKAYLEDNFKRERKDVLKCLKACRAIARMRGITWKAPKD